MAKITFITSSDEKITVDGTEGSVMELAVNNNVAGIDGDCGGVCSCATCHIFVVPEDLDKVGTASEIETDMLELADDANEYSRLCCQIPVTDALDNVVFTVAK